MHPRPARGPHDRPYNDRENRHRKKTGEKRDALSGGACGGRDSEVHGFATLTSGLMPLLGHRSTEPAKRLKRSKINCGADQKHPSDVHDSRGPGAAGEKETAGPA
jgi:hypothetical protein